MHGGCLFSRAGQSIEPGAWGQGHVIQGEYLPGYYWAPRRSWLAWGHDLGGAGASRLLEPAMALSVAIGASAPGHRPGWMDHEGPRPLAFARPIRLPAPRKNPFFLDRVNLYALMERSTYVQDR